jgi:predicted permease
MTLWNNFRYAARQLGKTPAFTLTILATLGLCIGANTAIYSVVDAVFFRPLPYPGPDRLVMIARVYQHNGASGNDTGQTGSVWELARDHASFLDSAVYGGSGGVNLFAAGRVEYVQQQRVSANFFSVLGVHPLMGREFTRQEDVPGGPPLAILSYRIWQRLFQGDPSIIGRTTDLRGEPYTVIGIMPRQFRTDAPADLWTPLQPSTSGEGSGTNYAIIARLKPGVTFAQVNGQLNSTMHPVIEQMHLPRGVSLEMKAVPMQVGRTVDLRSKIGLMWGAVGLVLVIGCINIAGILLARSATRSREIATRMALGAGRSAVIGQLLAEALLLAAGGGLIGLVVGQLATHGLIRLSSGQFEIWNPVQLDFRVMAVMLAISLATSVLFGLFPALEATSIDLRSALAEGGRSGAGSRRQWKRQALVFAEVALGVVLVIGAGLLIRTLAHLMNLNPGFNPDHVITASLSLQDARYRTTAAGARLFRESLARIRELPGVESAAVILNLPYQQALNLNVQSISGQPVTRDGGLTNFIYGTPEMFATLQMPLLQGRVFQDSDRPNSFKVAVVNQAFVKHYLSAGRDPLGSQVQMIMGAGTYQIVGIVADVPQQQGWGAEYGPIAALPQMYVPADQLPDDVFQLIHTFSSPSWIVRTRGDVHGLPDAMRGALQAVDPRLPFSAFHSMSDVRGQSLNEQRYQATLFSALAGLAILLAALGVYGLIAQSVAQRTREMGIRMALGATVSDVIRTAAAPGILLSVAGIAGGLLLALFATRLLKSLIWGVTPTDPVTFFSVAVLLILVAALASALPALRLTRLDPAQTLRNE